MKVRSALSDAAFLRLEEFCSQQLRLGLHPARYAEGLHAESADYGHFEIRGFHTQTGNPATITFDQPEDFQYADVEE